VAVHGFTLLSRTKPELDGISNFNPVFVQEATRAALCCQAQLALAVVGWQARPDAHKQLVAGLRAAAYGPRDTFAQNTFGRAVFNVSKVLALEATRRAQQLDPLYL
jgi:hypothetical protein